MPDAKDEIEMVLQRYNGFLLETNEAGLAGMFTADGALLGADGRGVHGSAAIEKHLEQFRHFRVEASTMTTESLEVMDGTALARGWYTQRAVIGTEVYDVSGSFEAQLTLGTPGSWKLTRMQTFPAQPQ